MRAVCKIHNAPNKKDHQDCKKKAKKWEFAINDSAFFRFIVNILSLIFVQNNMVFSHRACENKIVWQIIYQKVELLSLVTLTMHYYSQFHV